MKRYVDAVPSAPAPVALPWSAEEQLVTSTPCFIKRGQAAQGLEFRVLEPPSSEKDRVSYICCKTLEPVNTCKGFR